MELLSSLPSWPTSIKSLGELEMEFKLPTTSVLSFVLRLCDSVKMNKVMMYTFL